MQITSRAVVFAAALLASAPLLAAEAVSPMADTPTQKATTAQEDCWPASAEQSIGVAALLPRAGSTPDLAGIDDDFGKPVPCARPLGLQKGEPENDGSSRQSVFLTATPADGSMSWPRQRSFLESASGPASRGVHF